MLSKSFIALVLGSAILGAMPSHAQELSVLPDIVPPLSAEITLESPLRDSKTGRATRPDFAFRRGEVMLPPDDFYQTPGQIEPWLREIPLLRDNLKLRKIAVSSEGRDLLVLEITPQDVSPWKLRRLAILCRQHGNEPEATAAGAQFIYQLLQTKDPKKRAFLQKTALWITVIANPDGAARYQRRTAQNVDMNRDWGRDKSVEVGAWQWELARWKPHLIVDVHQWLPDERMPPPMAEASGGWFARQTAQAMSQANARRSVSLAARARWGLNTLAHRFWGQRFKVPAILLETRHRPGVPGARDLAIQTTLISLWSAVETVSGGK